MNILIFGGTGEAREIAEKLVAAGHDVTTSLAGRTNAPIEPKGQMRVGGFGTSTALIDFLRKEGFSLVIDATHPFAAQISHKVHDAATALELPLIRFERPVWEKPPEAKWTFITDPMQVRDLVPDDAIVMITTGASAANLPLDQFRCNLVVRMIEAPETQLPDTATLLLSRPPFSYEGELAVMRDHRITHLITKHAGGSQVRAKIDAAAELDIGTFLVARPDLPPARSFTQVGDLVAAVQDFNSSAD